MLRLLRTHNKWLLAIFGTLLLITFLVGGSFQSLFEAQAARGGTWATVGKDDRTVTTAVRDRVRAELQLVQVINDPVLVGLGLSNRPEHWYLLTLEAEEAGLIGGTADAFVTLSLAAEQIRLQAAMLGDNIPDTSPDQLARNLANQVNQPVSFVLETIAKVSGVRRLLGMYFQSPKLSDRRLERDSEELLLTAGADIIPIEARALAAQSTWEPTEEELRAQLAQFGNVPPGQGEYGFGYLIPNRVKLEWITIPVSAVRAALEASPELDNVHLRKHRERNRDLFPPATTDGSDDFHLVRDRVKEHLLSTLLPEQVNTVTKFATDQVALRQRGLQRDGDYLKLPDDWSARRKSFPLLAEEMNAQFGLQLPPYQTSGPAWLELNQIDLLPGIGTATTNRFGPFPIRLSGLVGELKEFGGSDAVRIQAGVTGPPLRSATGDIYIFRVLEAEAAHAPTSVDEVRPQLVADLRALREFRMLTERLEELRARAVDEGLASVAAEYNAQIQTASRIRVSDPLALQQGFPVQVPLPVVGVAPEATKAIVEQAAKLDPLVPVSDQPAETRTFAVPVESKLTVLVGRINRLEPLTREMYEMLAQGGALTSAVLREELPRFIVDAFSVERLAERHNFRLSREAIEEEAAANAARDGEPAPVGS